jgi:hypothetical protein
MRDTSKWKISIFNFSKSRVLLSKATPISPKDEKKASARSKKKYEKVRKVKTGVS